MLSQVIVNTNWIVITMIISFVVIINFLKYNDPNPKVRFTREHIIPQLILTYEQWIIIR